MFRPNSIMDLEIGHEMCSAKVGKSGIEIQSGKEGFGAAPAQHGAQHERAVMRNEVKVLTKSRLTTRIGLGAPSFDCGVPPAFAINLRRGGRQLGRTRKGDEGLWAV